MHRVTVTASADGVRQTLNEFEQFGRAQGLPDDLRRRFLVALDEVLSNVARHGRPPDGLVQVDFKLAGDRLTVTVEDEAPPFNPLDAAAGRHRRRRSNSGRPEAWASSWCGRFSESVQYEHTGGRNRLTMTDRLSRHADHS